MWRFLQINYFIYFSPTVNRKMAPSFLSCFIFLFFTLKFLTTSGQVTVSTCTELNNAIQRSNDGDEVGEIRVRKSIDASKCKGVTEISNSITIVGLGNSRPTISGGNSIPLFSVTVDKVKFTLRNLIITQGKSDYGGCVNIPYGLISVFISNVKFQGCNGNTGGGLFVSGGPTVLNSVEFESNFANNGGAIYNQGDANLLIINNCIFKNNRVDNKGDSAYGGAINSVSKLNISKSLFTQNYAKSSSGGAYGGAIYCSNNVNIFDSVFSKNSASSTSSEVIGGALHTYYDKTATIINSKFEKNSVDAKSNKGIGGAVYCGTFISKFSNFFSNSITSLSPTGGAIYCHQKAEILSSSFSSNNMFSIGREAAGAALNLGGNGGSSSISRSNFSSNTITASGVNATDDNNIYGGAIYSYAKLYLDRDIFTSNLIQFINTKFAVISKGGAVFCADELSVSFCSFLSNIAYSASSNAAGGALFAQNKLYVLSTTFTSNNATSDCKLPCDSQQWGGGAIHVYSQSIITLSTFKQNVYQSNRANSIASGGAVFYGNGYGDIMTVRSSTFINNRAIALAGNASGGAVGANPYYQIFANISQFTQNSAIGRKASGGAIFPGEGIFYSINSNFIKNIADASSGDSYGGAIDFSSSSQQNTILFSSFQENSAIARGRGNADGGAIFHGLLSSSTSYPLRLANSKFLSNSANGKVFARGGTLFVKGDHYLLLSRNSFAGSKAIADKALGGVIYGGKSASLSFCAQNIFDSNNAAISGKVTVSNNIYTAPSTTVTFCPSITVPVDSSSTFTPLIQCQNCNCEQYFNPCHPLASCDQINSVTFCTCPTKSPGTGFVCGRVDTCSSTI